MQLVCAKIRISCEDCARGEGFGRLGGPANTYSSSRMGFNEDETVKMAWSSSKKGDYEDGSCQQLGFGPAGHIPAPAGGPIREHRTDAKWLKPGKAPTLNRGTFGAKRRRGVGGLAPQCMKCHNRKTAAVRLPFCDSVGIRTQDPQLRRLLLYPAELRNQAPW